MTETPQTLEPDRLTTPRSAAIAGVVFAVLFSVSLALGRVYVAQDAQPDPDTLLGAAAGSGVVAQYLVPFAGIAFLWFIGVVRDLIGAREDRFFATVFLGSGILFVATLFSASASLAALHALPDLESAEVAFGRQLARSTMFLYSARTAGVFTLVTSTIVVRTRATPRWVAIAGYALGLVLLLTVSRFAEVMFLFPAWVALVSVVALVGAPRDSSVSR